MTATSRYTSPGRRGTSRPLTEQETSHWRTLTSRWHDSPPWTEQAEADNAQVRQALIDLYEDGVSLATLALAAGWGQPRTAGILHRARQEGLGTGTRRLIERERPAKQPYRRPLSEQEARTLTALYENLPVTASGIRKWRSEQASSLLAEIDRLSRTEVALDTVGTALGVSRQAIHQHLTRYRTTSIAA